MSPDAADADARTGPVGALARLRTHAGALVRVHVDAGPTFAEILAALGRGEFKPT